MLSDLLSCTAITSLSMSDENSSLMVIQVPLASYFVLTDVGDLHFSITTGCSLESLIKCDPSKILLTSIVYITRWHIHRPNEK